MREIRLSSTSRPIGPQHSPFVIAEMSGNHGGSLEAALAILDAAADAGADAVKLQTYTADSITINSDGPGFLVEAGPWAGRTLHDLYSEAGTPYDWHASLFERGRERGVLVFSSPFDAHAVDFLEQLGAPCYKVASPEVVDVPLLERIAATGKPVVVSTGMADEHEIDEALRTLRRRGAGDILLLHCISGYPTPPDQMNLATIAHLADRFGVPVGLSDHSVGIEVPIAAAALGACAIEKHVTLRRADAAVDAFFSLEPDELAALVRGTAIAHASRGQAHVGPTEADRASRPFRRSLYVVADVKAGDVLSTASVRSIRPGYGLPPRELRGVLGRMAVRDLRRGEPLSRDVVGDAVVAAAPESVDLGDSVLRLLTVDAVTDVYVDGLNDPEVIRFLVGPRQRLQTRETVELFVEDNATAGDALLYGVFVDRVLRGTVRLHDVRPGAAAHLGIALFDRSVWGRGLGRRAIDAVVGVARGLGVVEVVAGIAEGNDRSARAFAAAGFTHDAGADHDAAGLHVTVWRRPTTPTVT